MAKKNPDGTTRRLVQEALDSTTDECVVWAASTNYGGYGQACWEGRQWQAHRLICCLAHGEPPAPRMDAAHSCGNRACINPRHLRWATRAENMADRAIHGTALLGEDAPSAKLTAEQVREIRKLYAEGRGNQYTLASLFGVTQSAIGLIVRRKSWAHIR